MDDDGYDRAAAEAMEELERRGAPRIAPAAGPQPQPPIQQQAQLAWQQQWVQYTEEEQQAIAAANYEHLKSANAGMMDDDDMKEL